MAAKTEHNCTRKCSGNCQTGWYGIFSDSLFNVLNSRQWVTYVGLSCQIKKFSFQMLMFLNDVEQQDLRNYLKTGLAVQLETKAFFVFITIIY